MSDNDQLAVTAAIASKPHFAEKGSLNGSAIIGAYVPPGMIIGASAPEFTGHRHDERVDRVTNLYPGSNQGSIRRFPAALDGIGHPVNVEDSIGRCI
jgi:hypothetical protein